MKKSISILGTNSWLNIERTIKKIEESKADRLHIDVMDGHFVPNIALGPQIVKDITTHSSIPIDIHLMISCLDNLLDSYIQIKPKVIFIHPEAANIKTPEYLHRIKSAGISCGIAINPETPVKSVEGYLSHIDEILIMTVHPGFAGQTMIKGYLKKSEEIKSINPEVVVWVDGGVNNTTLKEVEKHPIDGVVIGSDFFKN